MVNGLNCAEIIRIWYHHKKNSLDLNTLQRYCSVLSEGEQRRLEGITSRSKREEFICSRWLMKNLLSRFESNSNPRDIVFVTTSNGRIKLKKNRLNSNMDLDFNLSHSKGMIAFAIGEKCSIGLDIEKIDSVNQNIARRYFHPFEISWIEEKPQPYQDILSCSLWTLKEAFGKAIGIGIVPVLKEPVFIIRKRSITFYENNKFDEHPRNWTFKLIMLTEGYVIAIAIKRYKHPQSIKLTQVLSLDDVVFTNNLNENGIKK